MKKAEYLNLKSTLIASGFEEEIRWQANLKPCDNPVSFRNEAIFVIVNSGMKAQIARVIYEKICFAFTHGIDISLAFGHNGKVAAIKEILINYRSMFDDYIKAENKIDHLQQIPFIGAITKYHLAKNLGHDCVKPDRHLVRIAKNYGYDDCNVMCKAISDDTGDKVSVVDIVLWRSANLGWI